MPAENLAAGLNLGSLGKVFGICWKLWLFRT
jgi:hypothetical protein